MFNVYIMLIRIYRIQYSNLIILLVYRFRGIHKGLVL